MPSQELAGALRLWRFALAVLAGFGGLFGAVLGLAGLEHRGHHPVGGLILGRPEEIPNDPRRQIPQGQAVHQYPHSPLGQSAAEPASP